MKPLIQQADHLREMRKQIVMRKIARLLKQLNAYRASKGLKPL
jgi:hypothetical protein